MENNTIETNVSRLLQRLSGGNGMGEPVVLVAATKTRTAEEIGRAVAAGVTDIGENRVQEFCEKYDLVHGARRHFIGRLQTNKVKYLVGRTYLIHSVDRDALADEIAGLSLKRGAVSDVLVEINVGGEASKGGYPYGEAEEAFLRLSRKEGLRVKGFMAMLPETDDRALLAPLCDKMRVLFERGRDRSPDVEYLSMGMSGDWGLCVERGANMIRLGSAIFGPRR